jgi:hypothetical protein
MNNPKLKVYDFKNKKLEDIPMVNEADHFELKLENNSIISFENIPENCKSIDLAYNK